MKWEYIAYLPVIITVFGGFLTAFRKANFWISVETYTTKSMRYLLLFIVFFCSGIVSPIISMATKQDWVNYPVSSDTLLLSYILIFVDFFLFRWISLNGKMKKSVSRIGLYGLFLSSYVKNFIFHQFLLLVVAIVVFELITYLIFRTEKMVSLLKKFFEGDKFDSRYFALAIYFVITSVIFRSQILLMVENSPVSIYLIFTIFITLYYFIKASILLVKNIAIYDKYEFIYFTLEAPHRCYIIDSVTKDFFFLTLVYSYSFERIDGKPLSIIFKDEYVVGNSETRIILRTDLAKYLPMKYDLTSKLYYTVMFNIDIDDIPIIRSKKKEKRDENPILEDSTAASEPESKSSSEIKETAQK